MTVNLLVLTFSELKCASPLGPLTCRYSAPGAPDTTSKEPPSLLSFSTRSNTHSSAEPGTVRMSEAAGGSAAQASSSSRARSMGHLG